MFYKDSAIKQHSMQNDAESLETVPTEIIEELSRLRKRQKLYNLSEKELIFINKLFSKRTSVGKTALQLILANQDACAILLLDIIELFHSIDPLQLNIQDDFGYNALCYALTRSIFEDRINDHASTPDIIKLLIKLGSDVSIALNYKELHRNFGTIIYHKDTLFWTSLNLLFHSKLFESEVLLAKLNVIEGITISYNKEKLKYEYVYINSQKHNDFHSIHDALWLYFEGRKTQAQKEFYSNLSKLFNIRCKDTPHYIAEEDSLKYLVSTTVTAGKSIVNILHFVSSLKLQDPVANKILQYFIKKLLNETAIDINEGDSYGRTALHIAATHGNLEIAKRLTEDTYINLTKLDGMHQTPLHRSLFSHKICVVQFFLNLGYDVNQQDKSGCSVLHRAVSLKNFDVIKLLLENGGVVEIMNNFGATPMNHAISNCASRDIVDLLKEYSKDLSFHKITIKEKLRYGRCTIL